MKPETREQFMNTVYNILHDDGTNDRANQIIDAFDEATESEKGKWVHLGGGEYCCDACGNVIHTEGSWEKPRQKLCPACGAEMEGTKDDA